MKNILNVNKASLKATLMSSIIVFSTFTFCSAIINKVACASFKEITLDKWNAIDPDYINHDPDSKFNEWCNYEEGQDPEFVDVNSIEEVSKNMKEARDFFESQHPKNRQEGLAMMICLANNTDFIPDQVKKQKSDQQKTQQQELNDEDKRRLEFISGPNNPYWDKSVDELKSKINKDIEESKSSQQKEELDDRKEYLEKFYSEYGKYTDEFLDKREEAINLANKNIEYLQTLKEKGIYTVETNYYSEEDGKNWEEFNSLFQQGGSSNPEENQPKLRSTEAQNDKYEYYYEEASDSAEKQPDAGSSCNIA